MVEFLVRVFVYDGRQTVSWGGADAARIDTTPCSIGYKPLSWVSGKYPKKSAMRCV